MSKDRKTTQVSFCPHCGHDAPQSLLDVHCFQTARARGEFYTFAKCETCCGPLVYLSELRFAEKQRKLGAFYYGLSTRDLLYPKPDKLHEAVPPKVTRCYMEALKIKETAPNAFTGSIRRCLEIVCNDRGAADDVLVKQLAELKTKGEIPPILAEMTDVIRLLGNSASHDDIEIDAAYVDTVDEFFRAVLDYVYVRPFQINEIRTKFEQAKKAKKTIAGK